jgi:hypothetical protein
MRSCRDVLTAGRSQSQHNTLSSAIATAVVAMLSSNAAVGSRDPGILFVCSNVSIMAIKE